MIEQHQIVEAIDEVVAGINIEKVVEHGDRSPLVVSWLKSRLTLVLYDAVLNVLPHDTGRGLDHAIFEDAILKKAWYDEKMRSVQSSGDMIHSICKDGFSISIETEPGKKGQELALLKVTHIDSELSYIWCR